MANENQIEFNVKIKKDGLSELASDIAKVESEAKDLATASATAGAGLEKLEQEAREASKGLTETGKAADQAGIDLKELRDAVIEKTTAIKAGLDVERSEIAIQQEMLSASRAEQQARLQSARARGDEREATEAQNALRQIESQQLVLVAQTKRAEAAAIEQATTARRDALAAAGPLNAALTDELRVSQNQATALKVQADAAEQAAQRALTLGKASATASTGLEDLREAVDKKTSAIKAGLLAEQSEIELLNKQLSSRSAEQQALLQAAQAKGDEAAATRSQNALRQIEADQLRLVAQAKRAEATAIDQATSARREELSAIGPLNSAQSDELRAAQNHANALRVEAAAADQAAQRTRDLSTAHKGGAAATDQMSSRVSNLSGLLRQMGGALSAAFTFREMVTAAAQMETLRAGLIAVSGDAVKAGQQLEFVRGVANRIGAEVTEVGKAFLGLSASTRGTAVEGQATRAVFEAVASSMGKAGKSSAETSNALNALAQMASKGVVQSEELRGQLGEALPGALQAAAKGMGITTAELMKLVEQGKITAQDLFPALTKGLNEIYGGAPKAQTLSQEITNIKNAFTDMSSDIGEAGGLNALKFGAEVAQSALVFLSATVVATGKSIGVLLAALTTWDFSGLKQSLADIEAEARDKLLKASAHNTVLRGTLESLGDEATKTALAQQDAGQAALAAGADAAQSGDNWIRLANGYRIVTESVREQIAEQEKSVIARDAEGKASTALAQAFGTEQQQRVAAAAAATTNAEGLEKLATLRLTELETLKAQLKSLQEEANAQGPIDEARAKQLADLEKLIGLRQQDADKAVAQAQGSRLAAEQAKVEAETYKDNSKRVAEYRTALLDALDALQRVREAQAQGKATTEQVTAADIAAGKAARLYKDALDDQVTAIKAKLSAELAGMDLQRATIGLAVEQQRAIYEIAKARGDEGAAIAAKNEISKLEIQLLELTAQARRAEALAALASIKAKREELEASNDLTEAKKLELEALTKAAEIKEVEAKIAETTAQKLRDLRSSAEAAGTSIDKLGQQTSNTAGLTKRAGDSMSGSWNGVASAVGKASQAVQEYNQRMADRHGRPGEGDQNVFDSGRRSTRGEQLGEGVQEIGTGGSQFRNKDGMSSNAQGQAITQGVWTRSMIIDYLKSKGLDESVAAKLSEQFIDQNGDVPYDASESQKRWGGRYGSLSDALNKMGEYYKYGAGQNEYESMLSESQPSKKKSAATGTTSSAPAQSDAPAKSSSSGMSGGNTYVSNITLGGKTSTVKFADANSQNTTEQLLRDLAAGKGAY